MARQNPYHRHGGKQPAGDRFDAAVLTVLRSSAAGLTLDQVADVLDPALCSKAADPRERLRIEAQRSISRLRDLGSVAEVAGRVKRFRIVEDACASNA